MQIGEVAGRVGLSLRTIRHYDEIGLVVPSERSAGGFRLYTAGDVERLALVKTLRPLDFSLDQVRELLDTIAAVASDSGADAESTARMVGRLAMFRTAADSRVEALRAQIHGLESLSRDLRVGRAEPASRTRPGAGDALSTIVGQDRRTFAVISHPDAGRRR